MNQEMKKLDLVAVMDRGVVFAERTGSAEDLANAREALIAVAELIEAAGSLRGKAGRLKVKQSDWDRLAYALARCTDGAA